MFIEWSISERVSQQSGVNLNNQWDTQKGSIPDVYRHELDMNSLSAPSIEHAWPHDGDFECSHNTECLR